MKRRNRSDEKKRSKRGQAYTEFVVVLPGVLLLLMLAWEFAYFWWGRMVVSTATFEAARQVAAGEPTSAGYAVYNEIMYTGLGQMSREHAAQGRGPQFRMVVKPEYRSVQAIANVPYRWPTGIGALMGGGRMNLNLRASAFFRSEQLYLGPPGGGGMFGGGGFE